MLQVRQVFAIEDAKRNHHLYNEEMQATLVMAGQTAVHLELLVLQLLDGSDLFQLLEGPGA